MKKKVANEINLKRLISYQAVENLRLCFLEEMLVPLHVSAANTSCFLQE